MKHITLLLVLVLAGAAHADPDFKFDHSKAVKTAMDALETQWKKNAQGESAKPAYNPHKMYDSRKAKFLATKVKDCKNHWLSMVIVGFQPFKGTGSSWAQLFLQQNGSFRVGETGASPEKVDAAMKEASSELPCDN